MKNVIALDAMISCSSDAEKQGYVDIAYKVITRFNVEQSDNTRVLLKPLYWKEDVYPTAAPQGPQAEIDKQLTDPSDILIAIFYLSGGSATEKYASGVIAEIERFLSANKQVFIYFFSGSVNVTELPSNFQVLLDYKQSHNNDLVYHEYVDKRDFETQLLRNLTAYFRKNHYSTYYDGWSHIIEKYCVDYYYDRNGRIEIKKTISFQSHINRYHIFEDRVSYNNITFVSATGAELINKQKKGIYDLYLFKLDAPIDRFDNHTIIITYIVEDPNYTSPSYIALSIDSPVRKLQFSVSACEEIGIIEPVFEMKKSFAAIQTYNSQVVVEANGVWKIQIDVLEDYSYYCLRWSICKIRTFLIEGISDSDYTE